MRKTLMTQITAEMAGYDQRDGTQDLVEGPPMAVTSSKLEAEAVVIDKELQDLPGKKT